MSRELPGAQGGSGALLSGGTARSLMAAVLIGVDVALLVLWGALLRSASQLAGVLVASMVTLVVGIGCLVGVIVLGGRSRTPAGGTRPNRTTAAAVLSAVSVLQLAGGFAAMTVLGGFSDLARLQVLLVTTALSVIVLALGVSVSRHVARTAAGAPGGPGGSAPRD